MSVPASMQAGSDLVGALQGKVAIVTGGGRGLGRAIVLAYLRAGACVVASAARSEAELQSLANEASSPGLLTLISDVSNPSDCDRLVAQTLERFGRVDVLVNNAARGQIEISDQYMVRPLRFWETEPAVWQAIIATNLNGPFFLARSVVPPMIAQRSGSIVNVSTNHRTMRRRGFSPYGPSKAAIESASLIWSQEVEEFGLRVNVLLPGAPTSSGMLPAALPDDIRPTVLQPQIITPPAVFLASELSRGLTGRRLVAGDWSPENPRGYPLGDGIALPERVPVPAGRIAPTEVSGPTRPNRGGQGR